VLRIKGKASEGKEWRTEWRIESAMHACQCEIKIHRVCTVFTLTLAETMPKLLIQLQVVFSEAD